MRRFVDIDFCCNDPNNGLFAGRVYGVQISGKGYLIEIEGDFMAGYAFRVEGGFIKMHRRKFGYLASQDWVGNWCWNRYRFTRAEAKRLIGVMRDNGLWSVGSGPARWFDWFNRFQWRLEEATPPPAHEPCSNASLLESLPVPLPIVDGAEKGAAALPLFDGAPHA